MVVAGLPVERKVLFRNMLTAAKPMPVDNKKAPAAFATGAFVCCLEARA